MEGNKTIFCYIDGTYDTFFLKRGDYDENEKDIVIDKEDKTTIIYKSSLKKIIIEKNKNSNKQSNIKQDGNKN